MIMRLSKFNLKKPLSESVLAALSAHLLTKNADKIIAILLSELLGGGIWT